MSDSFLGIWEASKLPKLEAWLNQVHGLGEPAGTDPHRLPWSFDAAATAPPFRLFGEAAPAAMRLAARASLTGKGEATRRDLFGVGQPLELAPSGNLAVLEVKAVFEGEASSEAALRAGRLKVAADLGAEISYRRTLPVRTTLQRSTAYRRLVTGSRLPTLLDLGERLEKGESHRLDLAVGLGLGLDFELGYGFAESTALELAEGLAPPFELALQASVEAALGLRLATRASLVVAAAGQRHEGWTRVRLQRENASRLSFGVTLALDLEYDLGTSLAQIFEKTLSLTPTPRLVRTSREILAFAQNPELLVERLSGEAGEVIEDLVAEKLIDPLTDSAACGQAIATAQEIVAFYDGLGGALQGLWDRLLSKVDLTPDSPQGQKVRGWLDSIAELEGEDLSLDHFLEGDRKDLFLAIETLSGRTFEDLLLDEGLEEALAEAASLAARAKRLLDDTDDAVLQKIRAFEEVTGIASLIERLRSLDTLEELRSASRSRVQRAAEKLSGRSLDQISRDDLVRLREWAIHAEGYLSFADPEDPDGKLRKLTGRFRDVLAEARVDCGLSLAFELERVARGTALLDYEIDPAANKKLLRTLSRSLGRGDLRAQLLALLDFQTKAEEEAEKNDKEPPELPFLIRECLFTSEKIRTSAVSSIFSLIGLGRRVAAKQSGRTQTIERKRLELLPGEGRRRGTFTAGLLRNDTTPEMAANAAVWLRVEDEGDLDPRQAFDGQRRSTLRMVFATDDAGTGSAELGALEHLLADFGFEMAGKRRPREVVGGGAPSRFACELRLPLLSGDRDVIDKIVSSPGSKKKLDTVFLDATLRWLKEELVTHPAHLDGHSIGQVVAHGVKAPWFVEHGRSSGALSGMPDPPRSIGIDGHAIGLSLDPVDPDLLGSRFLFLARKRGLLPKQTERLGRSWKNAGDARSEEAYERLTQTFTKSLRGLWLRGSWWPNPMFGLWFWIVALNELVPESLAQVRGLAVLRGPSMNALEEDPERWGAETYLLRGLRDNRGRVFKMGT